eukprot:TRINITY_DN5764_c0_g1_i3.p1 TRINITY_DN5764_c0_g1~~TRINITY_DN5764_c0_g1_i3.p1  ORF type:complete len:237 (-),score=46.27 TRINITY_DN5764_c0_g1_i3:79-789(-)
MSAQLRESLRVKANTIRQEILSDFKSLHEELDRRQQELLKQLEVLVDQALGVIDHQDCFEGIPVVDLQAMSFKQHRNAFGRSTSRLAQDIEGYGTINEPQYLPCMIEVVECTMLDPWQRNANLICKAFIANGDQFVIKTTSNWKFEIDFVGGVVEPSLQSDMMKLSVKIPKSPGKSQVRIRVSYLGAYFKDDMVLEFEPIQELKIGKIGDGECTMAFAFQGMRYFCHHMARLRLEQ